MAKNTAVRLLDDLDGRTATQTVRFSLDGVRYEIDLSDRNAKKLRAIFRRYIEKGHRAGKRPTRRVVIQQSSHSSATTNSSRKQKSQAGRKSASTRSTVSRKANDTAVKGKTARNTRKRAAALKTVQTQRAKGKTPKKS